MTTNVRLGMGSFNDKIVQPFAAEAFVIGGELPPGVGPGRYAFRHFVNLTDNSTAFAVSVCTQCLRMHVAIDKYLV